MHDIKKIRENPVFFEEGLRRRGIEYNADSLLKLDEEWRTLIQETQKLREERNLVSKEVASLMREGRDTSALIEKVKRIGDVISRNEERIRDLETKMEGELSQLPSILHDSVPDGKDESDNVVVRSWGEIRNFSFEPLSHWELGANLGLYDSERASKIARSRFSLTFGAFAHMERALINFMLDVQTHKNGYKEVVPPFLVNAKTLYGTGQLPKFKEELFVCEQDDLYLVPTAEVPLTNIHSEEILSADELPIRYTAYTPCFRREAGTYGRDTKGLIRLHQFNKVELVKFTKPEDSYDELESLVNDAASILEELELPYRVVLLCTGDTGFSSAKTYDLEVWLPSYNGYKEISSCSNFEDFQARRANIRFKRERSAKPEFVHTLNGSGLAVGRTLAAIIENYQTADGKVEVPKALSSYMGNVSIIPS